MLFRKKDDRAERTAGKFMMEGIYLVSVFSQKVLNGTERGDDPKLGMVRWIE